MGMCGCQHLGKMDLALMLYNFFSFFLITLLAWIPQVCCVFHGLPPPAVHACIELPMCIKTPVTPMHSDVRAWSCIVQSRICGLSQTALLLHFLPAPSAQRTAALALLSVGHGGLDLYQLLQQKPCCWGAMHLCWMR